jgi:hypothetical protein
LGVGVMTSPIHPPTPPEIVYAMHSYYCEGHSLRDVARKFSRDFRPILGQTIWKCFKRHGLPLRTVSHTIALKNARDAQTRRMYEDYKRGMSCKEIGERYSCSKAGVWARFHARGFRMRKPNDMRKGKRLAA